MIRNLHPQTRPQRTFDARAVTAEARRCGYEPSDLPARTIMLAGAPALVLSIFASLGAMSLVLNWLTPHWPTSSAAAAARSETLPPPRLETNPKADREMVARRQLDRLSHAPLSIDAAMAKIAEEGWRDRDEGR